MLHCEPNNEIMDNFASSPSTLSWQPAQVDWDGAPFRAQKMLPKEQWEMTNSPLLVGWLVPVLVDKKVVNGWTHFYWFGEGLHFRLSEVLTQLSCGPGERIFPSVTINWLSLCRKILYKVFGDRKLCPRDIYKTPDWKACWNAKQWSIHPKG